jgi:hypothetical protein
MDLHLVMPLLLVLLEVDVNLLIRLHTHHVLTIFVANVRQFVLQGNSALPVASRKNPLEIGFVASPKNPLQMRVKKWW